MGHAALRTGSLPKRWPRKGLCSPHTCKSSTWLSCAFMQQNQMPFSSLIPSRVTIHSFHREEALQPWASTVSRCGEIRKGCDVGRGGTGGINPNVPATVVLRQKEGQEGTSGCKQQDLLARRPPSGSSLGKRMVVCR